MVSPPEEEAALVVRQAQVTSNAEEVSDPVVLQEVVRHSSLCSTSRQAY